MDIVEVKNHFEPANMPHFFAYVTVFLASVTALYLWFVFYKGPRYMKDREPFDLINVIRAYNIFQFIACFVFVTRCYQLGFDYRYVWRCQKFEFFTADDKVLLVIGTWFFLGLRLFEYIETVFFILRKKGNQASFLHVYHHLSIITLAWLWVTQDTEWSAVYLCVINSFVHMIMYCYYFLSSFRSIRKYLLYIKPVITILQMAQFIFVMGHCVVQIWPGCDSGIFFYLSLINLIILFCLFGHFFIMEYIKSKNSVELKK